MSLEVSSSFSSSSCCRSIVFCSSSERRSFSNCCSSSCGNQLEIHICQCRRVIKVKEHQEGISVSRCAWFTAKYCTKNMTFWRNKLVIVLNKYVKRCSIRVMSSHTGSQKKVYSHASCSVNQWILQKETGDEHQLWRQYHICYFQTQLQSLTNMLHFLSCGAEPQLASLSPLCSKLHSQHSSWQIPKNASYHFIVLDREMRKLLHCYHNKAYYVCWWIGNDFCYTVQWLLLSKDN